MSEEYWESNEKKYIRLILKQVLKIESLNDWERNFIRTISNSRNLYMSDKQKFMLYRVLDKCKSVRQVTALKNHFK